MTTTAARPASAASRPGLPAGCLGLSEDHLDLRESVAAFASRYAAESVVRAAVDTPEGEDLPRPSFWGELAAQGLLGLHLPEDVGGAGASLVETAVVLEEFGRAMVPGPYLPTVLTSAVLHRAGHTAYLPALADGSAAGALALSGTLTAAADGEGWRVTGEVAPVLAGVGADVLVLPVEVAGEARWLVARASAPEITVAGIRSHDLTRRLARVTVDGLSIGADDLLTLEARLPLDLAATLYAAEATGLAQWATTTAADYAKVRHQFGRPIGQFQGVKHRSARMLARLEQGRACAWDAARSVDEDGAQFTLAAAVAGAVSVEAGYANAKACIDTLGSIGFTWEHDAGLYLRRAQSLRLLLGPTTTWQERVGALAAAGSRRVLGVELPPEADAIRADVRAELAATAGLEGSERLGYLADHGYAAPHLPRPWGRAAGAVEQLVVAQEMRAAKLRAADMIIGGWVVPTLIEHGSDAHKERFLRATLAGELVWCQLFSEPGAGSDLAALSTKAVKVDGGWRITGQKVWTSLAKQAHFGILLARSHPDLPKHQGLSYFLLDMSSPGVDIRPLRELTGESLFNEVFFDDVFIPDDMLVGEPGGGWRLARTTLANERVSLSSGSSVGIGGEALLDLAARGYGADQLGRVDLGAVLCDAQSLALLGLRTTLRSLTGAQPGAESSIAKLIGVDHSQDVWETAVGWLGPAAMSEDPGERGALRSALAMFLSSRCLSIAGGTTDVQLNIIGERLLGLPRDPEPGR